eukprot:g614.t1
MSQQTNLSGDPSFEYTQQMHPEQEFTGAHFDEQHQPQLQQQTPSSSLIPMNSESLTPNPNQLRSTRSTSVVNIGGKTIMSQSTPSRPVVKEYTNVAELFGGGGGEHQTSQQSLHQHGSSVPQQFQSVGECFGKSAPNGSKNIQEPRHVFVGERKQRYNKFLPKSCIDQAGGLLPGPIVSNTARDTLAKKSGDFHLGTEHGWNMGEKIIRKEDAPVESPNMKMRANNAPNNSDLHGSDEVTQKLAFSSASYNNYVDNFDYRRKKIDHPFFFIENKQSKKISEAKADSLKWNFEKPNIPQRGTGLFKEPTLKNARGFGSRPYYPMNEKKQLQMTQRELKQSNSVKAIMGLNGSEATTKLQTGVLAGSKSLTTLTSVQVPHQVPQSGISEDGFLQQKQPQQMLSNLNGNGGRLGYQTGSVTVLPQSRTIAQAESNSIADRTTFGIEKNGYQQRKQILFGSKGPSVAGQAGASIVNASNFKSGVHNNSRKWMSVDSIYSAAAPY